MSRSALILAAALAGGLGGCGSGMPTTYPVTGKVVWKGGHPAVGTIEFQSKSDSVKAVGKIGEDGNFSLTTHKDGKTCAGAVAGEHRVVVEVWVDDDRQVVIPLEKTYTVEAGENRFTIEIKPTKR